MDSRVSQYLLELHRSSHEQPLARFQEWALERLHSVIEFDAAWWGNGAHDPPGLHRLHLHRCEPRIRDDYPQWIAQDMMRLAMNGHPGSAVNLADLMPRTDFENSGFYRGFCRGHCIEQMIGTPPLEPVSSLLEFVTIWRHDARRPFGEAERQVMQFVVPHLAESQRDCRLHYLRHRGERVNQSSWALCDAHGLLFDMHPQFTTALLGQWPSWHGARLPTPLAASLRHGSRFAGRSTIIETTEVTGGFLLETRQKSVVDRLGEREREVAQHYAHGRTYVEIAQMLGISPSTVRNQLYSCFRKLEVNNKAELAQRLIVSARA